MYSYLRAMPLLVGTFHDLWDTAALMAFHNSKTRNCTSAVNSWIFPMLWHSIDDNDHEFWDSYDENLFAWRCWWYRWFCICICCRLLRVLSMFWLAVTLTRVSAGLLIFWSSTPWHWWSLLYWLSFTDQTPQHEQCSMNFLDWRHNFSDILPGQIQSITILWNNLDEDANKECQVDT